MKKYTKRFLAFLLATAMLVTGIPMNTKAAEEKTPEVITYDFGRPTTGVFSNRADDWEGASEPIMQGITGTVPTTASRTYTMTTSLAGTNWRLNPTRTIAGLAEGETSYPANNTGVNLFLWGNANSNWGKGKRTVMYLYGNKTVSFDLDVPETKEYQLSLVYYDNSTPRKLNITVDPESETPFTTQFVAATATNSTKMLVEEMAGTVVLSAGIHTVDIVSTRKNDAEETMIRALILTEVLPPVYEVATFNLADGTEFIAGTTFELETTAVMDNGADISNEISVVYSSSNDAVAAIEGTTLSLVAPGKATITAEVSYGGEVKETFTSNIVVKVEGQFTIDFTEIDATTLANDGEDRLYFTDATKSTEEATTQWVFDAAASHKDTYWPAFGLRVWHTNLVPTFLRVMSSSDKLSVIKFVAPAAGTYNVSVNTATIDKGGYLKAFVNGEFIGVLDGFTGNASVQNLLGVDLLEGENTISFTTAGKSGGSSYYFNLYSIDFFPTSAEGKNVVTGLTASINGADSATIDIADIAEETLLKVDATVETTGNVKMWPIFKSEHTSVATVHANQGTLTIKRAGSSTITATAGDFVVEIPLTVEDSRPRYAVNWVNDDGSEIKVDNLLEGAAIAYTGDEPVKEADAQYSYEFAGWVDAEGNPLAEDAVMGTEAVTYIAAYTATLNAYTVKFVVEGEVVSEEVYEYGTMPVVPEVKGYEEADKIYAFLGWDSEVREVTGDVTYTAVIEEVIQNYTITFADEDGTVLEEITVAPGDVPVWTVTPEKAADAQYTYTFTGWDKEVVAATGNEIYTAVYEATVNSYTVTWVNFDGTVLATESYEYGATPEYKGDAPVYNDYAFTGWSPEVATVKGDATYTAQFEMSGKSIEWFDEDGDGVAEAGYYYVDGAVKKGAGLVEVDGYLYWVLSTGKISVGTTRTIKANQTNGLIEAGTYYFLNNGVLETQEVRLSGEIRWVEEGGKQVGYYYVMNEVRKDVGLVEVWNEEAGEDTWYYVLFSGKVKRNYVADGKRVNQTVKAAKLNKYTGPEGLYSFYEDGVMYDPYATETGIVKYDATGKPWYYVDGHIRKDAGLVYVQRGDLAGNYIFVTFSGTLKKGTQSIKDKTCNGHTEFIGTQKFDNNTGAMIIK